MRAILPLIINPSDLGCSLKIVQGQTCISRLVHIRYHKLVPLYPVSLIEISKLCSRLWGLIFFQSGFRNRRVLLLVCEKVKSKIDLNWTFLWFSSRSISCAASTWSLLVKIQIFLVAKRWKCRDHDIYFNIIRISYIDVEFGKILCALGKYCVKMLFRNGPSTTNWISIGNFVSCKYFKFTSALIAYRELHSY